MNNYKINPEERSILEQLIYAEPFGNILEETGLQAGELRDNLINLINFGFIEAYETDNSHKTSPHFYDSDNLQNFTFRATSKGLVAI